MAPFTDENAILSFLEDIEVDEEATEFDENEEAAQLERLELENRRRELEELNRWASIRMRELAIEQQLDSIVWQSPFSVDTIRTGDRALDGDDSDWCSDMDDCLMPCDEDTAADTTEELTDVSDNEEDILRSIDWGRDINLNDLYNE